MSRKIIYLLLHFIWIGLFLLTLNCGIVESLVNQSINYSPFYLLPSYSLGAIYPGVPMFDNNGNVINAHGVGFIKVGDTYYMVGEQRSGKNDTYAGGTGNYEDQFTGINMYSTKDFLNWTFVGTVVLPQAGTPVYPPACGERPKILYNDLTGKYIIYIKMMTFTSTEIIHFAVCTSSVIQGPYTFVGNCTLNGNELTKIGDFNVFREGNTGYFCDCDGYLYQLSPDYLTCTSLVKSDIQAGEGVSLYKANDVYFWQSSGKSGWRANDNSYSTATSLAGPWTAHGYFCPSGTQTWQSQDTSVVPVTGSSTTTYMYFGDRWAGGDLPASTLVMLPLTVSGNTESIPTYYQGWNLNITNGTWNTIDMDTGIIINDDSVGTGQYQFNYSSGWGYATSQSGCYDDDVHSTAIADQSATIAFTGTQIFLYSQFSTSLGFMGVTLLKSNETAITPEAHISLYSSGSAQGNYLVYVSPVLPRDSYILKVRAFGKHAISSTSSTISIDRARIIDGSASTTPTPVPSATPTPKPNIALFGIASADSSQSGHEPSAGNDGDGITRWCAANGNTGHNWMVDLGNSYTLSGTEVDWETTNVYKYIIEISPDGSSWSTIVDKTANTVSTNIAADNFTATGRYVKITITGLETNIWASFFEFKVFE